MSSSSKSSEKEDNKGIIHYPHLEEDDTRRLLGDPQNSASQEPFFVPMPKIEEDEDQKSLREGSFSQPPQLIREVSDG